LIDELIHVSASLREDGGGAAHFGRVISRALRRFASRHGLAFRGLHLPAGDGHPALDGYESFGGSRLRLAARVAALQLGPRGRHRLLLFDHPGPARIQGWLPVSRRSRYAVWILGIDVWRDLPADLHRSLAAADRVVAISRVTVERARPFLPAGCRIEVVHPGIEATASGGEVDPLLLDRLGEGFVLSVSRLPGRERRKGHDELLEAWAAVRQRVPRARLVVAGDGPDRARLVARARELGLADCVEFIGWVSGATRSELYRRCALFALPSMDEGFGLVFAEAMATGRPCVAWSGTAPAEIFRDGEEGRLVPAGQLDSLAAAIGELLGDAALRDRLGKGGRKRFEDEFSESAFERRVAALLDRLLAETAP